MSDLDRREQLEAALDAAEEGTLDVPEEKEIIEDTSEESIQDEIVDENNEESTENAEIVNAEDSYEEPKEEIKRPSTWKKEYVDVWDKMKSGKQISEQDFNKFAEYANQRESEYKKGVSVYKAEADNARQLTEAIAPFAQDFQQQGVSPAAWINNLGRAHMILSKAPYNEKVQMFQRLAQDYGIQLNGQSVASAQQVDPYTQQLMNQLNMVNQEVSSIKGRFAQEENQRLTNEIERHRSDVDKFPHFDQVREEMAQLLELGKAQDLETAYKKAVRMNDDVWSLEQERLLKSAKQTALKSQQVAKAKSAAVQTKSSIPSGSVNSGEKKDRRDFIAEQLGEAMSRRV